MHTTDLLLTPLRHVLAGEQGEDNRDFTAGYLRFLLQLADAELPAGIARLRVDFGSWNGSATATDVSFLDRDGVKQGAQFSLPVDGAAIDGLIAIPAGTVSIVFHPAADQGDWKMWRATLTFDGRLNEWLPEASTARQMPTGEAIDLVLEPHIDVERLPDLPNAWIAHGEDPSFLLVPSEGPFRSGFVLVTLTMTTFSEGSGPPSLYLDYGYGFSEANRCFLRSDGQTHYEVIYVTNGLQSLRFDPVDVHGPFVLENLQVSYLPSSHDHSIDTRFLPLARSSSIALTPVPTNHLVALPYVPHGWESVGDDPIFLLRFDGQGPETGLTRIRFEIHSIAGSSLSPILYVDRGDELSQNSCYSLNLLGNIVDDVILLDRNARGLRLDPLDGPGFFTISEVLLAGMERGPTQTANQGFKRDAQERDDGCDLESVQDLRSLAGLQTAWETTGPDPVFYLKPRSETVPTGPVHLSFNLWSLDNLRLQPSLYLDVGLGFNEANRIEFPVVRGRVSTEIFLPAETKALRLDPTEGNARFLIENIQLRALPQKPSLVFPKPVNDLERSDVGWKSTGSDPHFALPFIDHREPFKGGWYRILADLKPINNTDLLPSIYVDSGSGYSESSRIKLNWTMLGIDDVVLLPDAVRLIRFDPLESTGLFSLSFFSLLPCSELEAFGRLVQLLQDRRPQDARAMMRLAHRAAFTVTPVDRRRALLNSRPAAPSGSYAAWIELVEKPNVASTADARAIVANWTERPRFSIVMPVYNTPEEYLVEAIESVLAQSYEHWELCICDDNSSAPDVRAILARYAAADSRVKVVLRAVNGHISRASNDALAMATGEFMVLMDHDDLIPPNALFEFACALTEDPEIDFIYSDEDKISEAGLRHDPFFKPDWSPEYLESCMYTAHLAAYRMDIVSRVGGFRPECDGAQDYDFVLRYTEHVRRVRHISKVLYHWRTIEGSTAQTMDNKSYVIDAAVRGLSERLERTGSVAVARPSRYKGCFETRRSVVANPLVSIVIPSAGRNGFALGQNIDLLANCISSLHRNTTYRHFEVIIVDNGDLRDSTIDVLNEYDLRRITYTKQEVNVAAKMNIGAAEAKGEYILFLNDDIQPLSPDWLTNMVSLAQRDGVGGVGPRLLFDDGRVQSIGVTFCNGLPDEIRRGFPGTEAGYFFSTCGNRNYLAVTGACFLVRRDIFSDVGGFDENLAINYNDIDLCLKLIQKGLRIAYCGFSELYHFESQTRERVVDPKERDIFLERWEDDLRSDPFYSDWFQKNPPTFEIDPNRFRLGSKPPVVRTPA